MSQTRNINKKKPGNTKQVREDEKVIKMDREKEKKGKRWKGITNIT